MNGMGSVCGLSMVGQASQVNSESSCDCTTRPIGLNLCFCLNDFKCLRCCGWLVGWLISDYMSGTVIPVILILASRNHDGDDDHYLCKLVCVVKW